MANNPKHLLNLKSTVKGQILNPKGRPKKLPKLDVLLAKVLGTEDPNGVTEAEKILKSLQAMAKKGNVRAAEILLDRSYGKVKQQIEVDDVTKINRPIVVETKEQAEALQAVKELLV